jgi:hypothetical protein
MASITNAELTVTTNRPEDRASVVITCDVEFTEVEVNAMKMLGLQYTLHCQVLNRDMLDEEPVASYHHQQFPRVAGMARRYELKNEENSAELVKRTEVIAVDRAA